MLWFNDLLDNEFLEGKIEAEYLNYSRYEEIFESVNLKTAALSMIVEEIKHNTLKTEKLHTEQGNGLSKEKRREQVLKVTQAREQIFKDIAEHNRRILRKREETIERYSEEQEEGFVFLIQNILCYHYSQVGLGTISKPYTTLIMPNFLL